MKRYSFIHPDPELQNNLMAFGFECGKGWYPLIEELFDEIEKIEDKNGLEILQVKEKWGMLTIYYYGGTEEIDTFVDDACKKSTTICENCGKLGEIKCKGGWYFTVCDDCFDEGMRLVC